MPSVEDERACDGNGNGSGDNGDGDDTESGGNTDSQQVEGAQLSTESQHTRRS